MLRKLCILGGILAGSLGAESGANAWLRYDRLSEAAARPYRLALPAAVASFGDSAVLRTAQSELIRGIRGMLGRTLRIESQVPSGGAILIGTMQQIRQAVPQLPDTAIGAEGYWLTIARVGSVAHIVITGPD